MSDKLLPCPFCGGNQQRVKHSGRWGMNRSYCECPHCGKQFPVSWYWDTDKFAYLDDTVAEVVTDRDCLDATRAVYVVRRRCPYCGARLRVWHELVPRFYAFEEVDHDAD